jgi:hypothetical protein
MTSATVELGDFIRRETAILRRWEARVRGTTEVAHDQPRASLLNQLPDLLDTIAKNAALVGHRVAAFGMDVSARHAAERLEQGYGLAEVVVEYVELRACIFERLEELGLVIEPLQSGQLHRTLDHALRDTARRYVTTHEKMLRAMDRLTGERTARRSLDEVLGDILQALRQTTGAEVDSVAILLLGDDGRLHIRATLGLEADMEMGTYGRGQAPLHTRRCKRSDRVEHGHTPARHARALRRSAAGW